MKLKQICFAWKRVKVYFCMFCIETTKIWSEPEQEISEMKRNKKEQKFANFVFPSFSQACLLIFLSFLLTSLFLSLSDILFRSLQMYFVLLHLLYLALVDFFFFDLSFFSGTVCLRHLCPALICFISGHNNRRSDFTKLFYRTCISMPNFIGSEPSVSNRLYWVCTHGMHAVSLLQMFLPRYTLKNPQFVVFCSVTNDLIFTKTNDAVRLSAWLGWKQTVTCLVAEKPVF